MSEKMLSWEEFKGSTAEEWFQKAIDDLKGKVDPSLLISTYGSDIKVSPFLTGNQISPQPSIKGLPTKPATYISVTDEKSANIKIMETLEGGTEALWLQCNSEIDLSKVLEKVYPEMIHTFINASDEKLYGLLRNQINAKWGEHLSSGQIELTHGESGSQQIDLHQDQTLDERLNLFKDCCLSSGKKGEKFFIHVELKTDFLAQIAELRAFHKLWQVGSLDPNKMIIFSCITDAHLDDNEHHGMIPISYLILSGQLGMSHYILDKLSAKHSEYSRLLLNAQHIFSYETGVGKVSDPLAGAYTIEKLTELMISTTQNKTK